MRLNAMKSRRSKLFELEFELELELELELVHCSEEEGFTTSKDVVLEFCISLEESFHCVRFTFFSLSILHIQTNPKIKYVNSQLKKGFIKSKINIKNSYENHLFKRKERKKKKIFLYSIRS
jgi:hypothetical protein